MNVTPFNINAQAESQTAMIRITGTIGWDTNSELFRKQIDGIKKKGVRNAHLYLHGPGGSCFDAEEIVNIIRDAFTGKITGEGGALVASAYTRIAMMCDTFIMPENGIFMIHKPRGGAFGTVDELISYANLLKSLDEQYFEIYKVKVSDTELLSSKWSVDWWMTSKEAKSAGFITDIKGKTKIDENVKAVIIASGCPENKIPIININRKKEMDLKQMAVSLGLPENATEIDVNAAIEKGKKAQSDLKALEMATKMKEMDEKKSKIKAALDEAERSRRITADLRAGWAEILDTNLETGIKMLEGIQVVKKPEIAPGSKKSVNKTTYLGKTFDELQESNPDALADLEKLDPDAFLELFNDR